MLLNVIESYIVHAKRILRDRWTRTHLNATVRWTVAKSVSAGCTLMSSSPISSTRSAFSETSGLEPIEMQQSGGLLPSGVSAGCSLMSSSPISSTQSAFSETGGLEPIEMQQAGGRLPKASLAGCTLVLSNPISSTRSALRRPVECHILRWLTMTLSNWAKCPIEALGVSPNYCSVSFRQAEASS